jgi:hypothetical protein
MCVGLRWKGEDESGQTSSLRWPVSTLAPLWAYIATGVVIVSVQIESHADWWLRAVIAAAALAANAANAANAAIITAIHRRWRHALSHRCSAAAAS